MWKIRGRAQEKTNILITVGKDCITGIITVYDTITKSPRP